MSGAIEIEKDPEAVVEQVVFEQAIVDLAAGMRKLNGSRLKREAVVILLHASTRVAKRDIDRVLNGLDDLERTYLKPKPPKEG